MLHLRTDPIDTNPLKVPYVTALGTMLKHAQKQKNVKISVLRLSTGGIEKLYRLEFEDMIKKALENLPTTPTKYTHSHWQNASTGGILRET